MSSVRNGQPASRSYGQPSSGHSGSLGRVDDAVLEFDLETALGSLFNSVARQYSLTMQAALRPYRVMPGQLATLFALLETDGLTQSALSQQVGVEQPTMANTLRRMERDGLVRRVQDRNDRRITRHFATDEAREIGRAVRAAAKHLNDQLSHGLSEMERLVLPAVLRKINRNLGNIEADYRQRPEEADPAGDGGSPFAPSAA